MCGHAIYVQGVAFVKEYRAYREELRASSDVTQHVNCSNTHVCNDLMESPARHRSEETYA